MSESEMKGTLTLILGGVRSGKSRFGQELAHRLGGDDVLFVATAESRDDEMARRIAIHRQTRPGTWKTLEQPLRTGNTILAYDSLPSVVLVDCLTLLVSNVLLEVESDLDSREGAMAIEVRMNAEVDALIAVAREHDSHVIVVSGEVGMGVVPEYAMGRLFRDLLGWANQRIASRAAATYLMVAGLPIEVSSMASSIEKAAQELVCQSNAGATQ